MVGWFKSRARTLIAANSLDASYWPIAMRWASEAYNRSVLGQEALPAFGQPVLHKLKRPSGAHKELLTRWIQASYGAPHLTIPDGHVLITSEGNLVASKGFRTGVVDTKILEEVELPPLQEKESTEDALVEEEALLLEEGSKDVTTPERRLREKTTVRFLEEGGNAETSEDLAKALLSEGNVSDQAFRHIVHSLERSEATSTDRRGEFEGRFVLGAYCHGGQRGMTTLSKQYPYVVQFLNKFLKSRLGDHSSDATWSSLLLMHASDVPVHRDFRNEWNTMTYVLAVPGAMQLWVGPEPDPKVKLNSVAPDWNASEVLCFTNEVKAFNPRCYHAVRRTSDWVIAAYTPLGIHKLQEREKEALSGLGFPMNAVGQEEHKVCVIRQQGGPEGSRSSASSSQGNVQGPLSQDEQGDHNTPLVGWDLSEGARRNQPTGDSLPRDLQLFLWERDIEYLMPELQRLGIEEPEDLIFLFEEDLIEFGMTRTQASRVLFGVHPPGTRRPDNPNISGLRTGEVRLFDRDSQQIPWVLQNRTLSQSCPGPPLQNLGVRTEAEQPSSSSSRPWHEPSPEYDDVAEPYQDEVLAADPPPWDPPPWETHTSEQPAASPPWSPSPWEIPTDIPAATSLPIGEEPAPEPAAHYWEDEWTTETVPAGYFCGFGPDSWHSNHWRRTCPPVG